MNYNLAVELQDIEKRICKARKELARLACAEAVNDHVTGWARHRLDRLYKLRRDRETDIQVVKVMRRVEKPEGHLC